MNDFSERIRMLEISSMTEDERRHPDRFVLTSGEEEIVEAGKPKRARIALYDTSGLHRPIHDHAAGDDPDQEVDRPARLAMPAPKQRAASR